VPLNLINDHLDSGECSVEKTGGAETAVCDESCQANVERQDENLPADAGAAESGQGGEGSCCSCPVCDATVPLHLINDHLDGGCMEPARMRIDPSGKSPAPQQPEATVVPKQPPPACAASRTEGSAFAIMMSSARQAARTVRCELLSCGSRVAWGVDAASGMPGRGSSEVDAPYLNQPAQPTSTTPSTTPLGINPYRRPRHSASHSLSPTPRLRISGGQNSHCGSPTPLRALCDS
jgi:hypothetical protein